ncbi:hypothetical protein C7434_0187 [Pantoea sp. PNA 14-12]|nr:hypothetical protein C7434_0187 [Pantoea sp. PNA 14-12]
MNGIFNAILYIIDENLIIHFSFKHPGNHLLYSHSEI